MTTSAMPRTRRQTRFAAPTAGPYVAAVREQDARGPIVAATMLAERDGRELVLLNVLEPLPLFRRGLLEVPLQVEFEEERRAAVSRGLRETIVSLGWNADRWPIEVVPGSLPETIVRFARRHGAPVLVVGIGRHRPIDRLMAGEETLRIIRLADRPVLAVPSDFSALPTTAVAAIDFSPASVEAAQGALDVMAPGGVLHLLHVWAREGSRMPELLAREADYERRIPELMHRIVEMLDVPDGVDVVPLWMMGDPVSELLAFASERDATMIAVGRRGNREWYERLLLGSVATRLVRGSRCAVLVAPEPPVAMRERIERLVTGASTRTTPEGWQAQLAAFSRRNEGRRTVLEVDDPVLGAQSQETGYTLLGATFDPHDHRVELMFGGPAGGTAHFTRSIGEVDSVSVVSESGDAERDAVLRIGHGNGQTLLMFLPSWDEVHPA